MLILQIQRSYISLTLRYIFTNALPDTKTLIPIYATYNKNNEVFLTYEISTAQQGPNIELLLHTI